MRLGKALIPLLALPCLGAAPADDASSPPLAPQGEAADREATSPSPDCIGRVIGEVERAGGRLERAQATVSERWGRVWRADVALPDTQAGRLNRAICWSGGLRLARDQAAQPLATGFPGHRPAAAPCDYTPIDNPCRDEPVRIIWLCVRPQFDIYADGHAEPAPPASGLQVGFVNQGAPESDAAWAARCRGKGGIYEGGR